MRAGELKSLRVAVLGMSLAVGATAAGPARAFDPGAGVTKESGPFALFKFGFSAYKSGRKDEAVERLENAMPLAIRYAGPVIADPKDRSIVCLRDSGCDRWTAVVQCVLQEVDRKSVV